jgi:hypothetical protein
VVFLQYIKKCASLSKNEVAVTERSADTSTVKELEYSDGNAQEDYRPRESVLQ